MWPPGLKISKMQLEKPCTTQCKASCCKLRPKTILVSGKEGRRSLWAFTVGVHCGRQTMSKRKSTKNTIFLLVKVARAYISLRFGRGKVEFVLYCTGFGERHGAHARHRIKDLRAQSSRGTYENDCT